MLMYKLAYFYDPSFLYDVEIPAIPVIARELKDRIFYVARTRSSQRREIQVVA